MGYLASGKSTGFHHKKMQFQAESISFGLFLNLQISGTPHLNELIFWIYMINTKYNI